MATITKGRVDIPKNIGIVQNFVVLPAKICNANDLSYI
jgi:hypothetical protein